MSYIAPPQAGEEHRRIKFIVAWSHYRVGDEIVPNGTLRSFLVSNGYAVPAVRTGAQRSEPPTLNRAMGGKGKRYVSR